MRPDQFWDNYLNNINKEIGYFNFLCTDITKLHCELEKKLITAKLPHSNSLIADIIVKLVINKIMNYVLPTILLEKQAFDKLYQPNDSFSEFLNKTPNYLINKYKLIPILYTRFCANAKQVFFDLIENVSADYHELCDFMKADALILESVTPVGDVHENGRTTLSVNFLCNDKPKKIIYKAQNLQSCVVWNNLIHYVTKESDLSFKTFNIMAKNNHGYIEHIEQISCPNEALPQYYARLGGLLAMVYIFAGNDVHGENVIANGEFPIIIDIETFFQPIMFHGINHEEITHSMSVLMTSILPLRTYNAKLNKSIDCSPFRNGTVTNALYKSIGYSKLNNELVINSILTNLSNAAQNIPNLTHEPLNFHGDFIQGFEKIYKFILSHKTEILNICSNLTNTKIRWLIEATAIYTKITEAIKHPTILSDIHNYEAFIHKQLSKPINPIYAKIRQDELKSLLNFAIPTFWVDNQQKQMLSGYDNPQNFKIRLDSFNTVKYILDQRISLSDLQIQKFAIMASIYNAIVSDNNLYNRALPTSGLNLFSDYIKQNPKLNSINECINLLADILDITKIQDEKARLIGWHTTKYLLDNSCTLSHTTTSLYDGLAGIALTYAALSVSAPHKEEHIKSVKQCLRFIYDRCRPENKSFQDGMYGTTAGVLLGLSSIYNILGYLPGLEPDEIKFILTFLTSKILEQNTSLENTTKQTLDLTTGTLGNYVALLRAHQTSEIFRLHYPLEVDTLCDTICKMLPHEPNTSEEYGLAHGTTAILYAHYLLAAFSTKYRVEFERFLNQYFKQILPIITKTSSLSWCKGLGGVIITLLKIYNSKIIDTSIINRILSDLTKLFLAHIANYKNQVNFNFSLCHGLSGDLEVINLLYGANLINKEVYISNKQIIEELILNHLNTTQEQYDIGLFTGYAGSLYQLIRTSNPNKIPAIL